ncbi:MAG: glycosyltransferase [Acidimicrobiales bacterium]
MTGSLPALLVLSPSADMYGSDRALLGLLDELRERYDVTIVSAVDGPMLAEARRRGASVVVSPDWALRRRFFTPTGIVPALWRIARTLVLIRRLHRERRFVMTYANTVANTLLPFLPLALRAPLVVHVREVPRTGARLNGIFFGQISRVATALLCNSTFTASFVSDLEPRLADRLRVVHDGVDPVDVPGAASGPAPHDGPLEIVCVGRIHPQKGQQVMIEALASATAAGHDWRVHFWGDALPEHAHLLAGLEDEVRRNGLADRVVWHGYGGDAASMYGGMDVAVVPSTWPEGFSLVTAEAQAAGLPAVATGPGGPSDIIDDGVTGRIVPFDDAAAVVAALTELEAPGVRAAWGAAGHRRFLEHFTTQRSATAVCDALVGLSGPVSRSA